jgi:hypothetical protein
VSRVVSGPHLRAFSRKQEKGAARTHSAKAKHKTVRAIQQAQGTICKFSLIQR